MAQATFSVRMDSELRESFRDICNEFGMNMATAINIFARAVVRERKIPFEITANDLVITRSGASQAFANLREDAKNAGVSDMSLEEINKEIDEARK